MDPRKKNTTMSAQPYSLKNVNLDVSNLPASCQISEPLTHHQNCLNYQTERIRVIPFTEVEGLLEEEEQAAADQLHLQALLDVAVEKLQQLRDVRER